MIKISSDLFSWSIRRTSSSLELMNGGNMFDIIQGPKVSRDAVEKSYGVNVAQIFDDCNGCIAVAMDYVSDKKHA